MKIQLEIPDTTVEQIVRGIMDNFPESSSGSALVCVDYNYDEQIFRFVDTGNEDKEYTLTKEKLVTTFPLIFTEKWPKGCTKPPMSANWDNWDEWLCQCDATDFDAFAQLACLGEVIYG